jgi:hypothetical protein
VESRAPAIEVSPKVDFDEFHREVIVAAGLREDRLSFHWQLPQGSRHTHRWLVDLALTPEQAVECVRAEAQRVRERGGANPLRPSAFDRAMADLARDLAAPPLTPSPHRPRFASDRPPPDRSVFDDWPRLKTAGGQER